MPYINDYDVARIVYELRGDMTGKIQAIKAVRSVANIGLKEAKDTIDAVCSKVGGQSYYSYGTAKSYGLDTIAQAVSDEMMSRWQTKTWDNDACIELVRWKHGDVESLLAKGSRISSIPTTDFDPTKVATIGADTTLRMLDMLAALVKEQRETNNLLKDLLSVMED